MKRVSSTLDRWHVAALLTTLLAAALVARFTWLSRSPAPGQPRHGLSRANDGELRDVARAGLVRHGDRRTHELLDNLEASGSTQAVAALVLLAEAHVAFVAPKIIAALARSRDPNEQTRLLEALGETADASALDVLTALSASPVLAQPAYLAIGRIGGPRAQKFLTEQLSRSADADVSAVAQGLASIGGAEVHRLLEQAMLSKREVRRLAVQAVLLDTDTADVREFMLRELTGSDPEGVIPYFNDAVESRAIPALEKLARDRRANLPLLAIQALINQGPEGRAAIARLLHADPSAELASTIFDSAASVLSLRPTLRAAAIARLQAGATSHGSWFDYLAGDLSDEARAALVAATHDLGSSSSAIFALASRADRSSVASLELLSHDPDQRLAKEARSALERDADARSEPALLLAMRSSDPEARQEVLVRLLEINAEEGQRALDAACSSGDAQERARAPQLLLQFGPEHPQRRLEALANDPEVNVASAGLGALLAVDRDRAEQIISQALRSGPASFRFAHLNSPEYPDILANFARTADPAWVADFVAAPQVFGYAANDALERLAARSDLPEATRLRAQELSQDGLSKTKKRRIF